MSINRGDIFYVNPSETVGSEQRSGRPAIIVSNPLCNEHSPVVEVVYLTCQYKKPMPTHVRIESAGKRSTALCEQISSVDVSRLGDFKGHLTDREMAQVDVALMASLDLHPIPRQAKVRPVGPDVDDAALALIALRFLEGFLQKRCGVTVQDRLSIDLLGQKQRLWRCEMKGFYQRRSDGQMADMPPCGLCLHKNKATYQSPCYNCIDIVDLCLHRPNAETEFANFVPAEGVEAV